MIEGENDEKTVIYNSMEILTLEWKNAAIGTISERQIDMWYIEAVFTSNKTEHAANFKKLVSCIL
jgi:hypothetical protein